jgi:formate-dependent phosphoribosylglycinamide formyltransferase (GAR transformylase)
MKAKRVKCLFCEKSLSKAAAKLHTCPDKRAAERRMGVELATYDAVQFAVEKEN